MINEGGRRMQILSIKKFKLIIPLSILFALVMICNSGFAFGASSVTIATVDYKDENVIVNNNDNSKIYFATENDAARNMWELIPADAGATTAIDFSWVAPTTEQAIVIKGEDNVQSRVVLKERARRLDVSISYDKMSGLAKTDTIARLLNIMSSAGTGESPIDYTDLEWKKGENGSWKDTSLLTVALLEKLQIKGADLYFRIKAVNDETSATNFPDGTGGRRISKEVRLRVTKKASPVVVGIDGEEFTANIRYGKEYRASYGGITTNWVKVTDRSVRHVALKEVVNNSRDGLTANFPSMIIEIRDYATAKAASSKITEIQLKEQRILTGDIKTTPVPEGADKTDSSIYMSYNGSASVSITIPSASSENPYQYTIVKPGIDFDVQKVSWTTITKSSAVRILSTRAIEGSEIYIRQKDIRYKAETKTAPAVDFELASTYKKYTVEYPAVPAIEAQSFTFVKGVTEGISFSIKLNDLGKLPYETSIKSIKYGTRDIKFTTTSNLETSLDPNKEYVMNVTLDPDDLNSMPNSYSRVLSISFERGTADKTSIRLALKNPTSAYALTANAMKGSVAGTTSVKVTNNPKVGNELVYAITATKVEGLHTDNIVTGGVAFVQQADITVTAGQYLTVYEVDSASMKVVRFKCFEITSLYIK